jgi:RNA ligase
MIDSLNDYCEMGLLHKQAHPTLPLFIWNYTPKVQYEKLWDSMTLKCRGLVTDHQGNVIAKSFDKFFNLEELSSSDIPAEPFEVYEKLDGSLILVFWYQGQMVVASKGSFDSNHALEAKSIINTYDINKLDNSKIYCGELIVPWNRIVVGYGNKRSVVLLAKFDEFGNEYPINHYEQHGFEVVKKFELSNLDFFTLKQQIRDDEEGYVVRFRSGKRLKIKGQEYIRLHKIVTGISSVVIWENMMNNISIDVILEQLPDEFYNWAKDVQRNLQEKYNSILEESMNVYRELETRKDTALYFLEQKYPQVLFSILNKKDPSKLIWKLIKPDYKTPFGE